MDSLITRLATLVDSDPGFYVLAVHSLIGHYLRDVIAVSEAERFPDLIADFRASRLESAGEKEIRDLSCLKDLARQHRFTNDICDSFLELDSEEAVAASHLFLVFAGLLGIRNSPGLKDLERHLQMWDSRAPSSNPTAVLARMQHELEVSQTSDGVMLLCLPQLEETRRAMAGLEHEISRFSLEIDALLGRRSTSDARSDALRRERQRLYTERRSLRTRMAGLANLEGYIANLGRLSVYTKARMDYERSVIRLAADQADAVAAIDRTGHFLIRGSAGTGKSLVLVEALRRALEVGEFDFAGEPDRRALLLTFTKTLAKFEDYVTSILRIDSARNLVQTVDAFLLARLRRIDPGFSYEFRAVDRLVAQYNTTDFFSHEELSTEIENYLFGNFVTHEEYVDEVVDRVGLRRRLSRRQRERVWQIRETVAADMESTGKLSRNYARIKILNHLSAASEEEVAKFRDVRTIYLDEAQDLTAGDLLTLRSLVSGHLIMAADSDQTIYGVTSPYARAGISVSGRARVLKTNFRNTRQIHELSMRFRGTRDDGDEVIAFREGPPAELYTAEPEKLLELLLAKLDLFLAYVGYDPEHIAILAPGNAEVERLGALLAGRSIPAEVITSREFQFTDSGAVRLSTLHSSKGLDFPVVLLYLPYLQWHESYDRDATEALLRNLIFVGITRAMENLSVFACPTDDRLLHELIASFGRKTGDE